ncbi:Glyoxalase-like domain protein [Bacillus cereus]|nr:Glyoxalase-like domain protein [Bacillus cereus]
MEEEYTNETMNAFHMAYQGPTYRVQCAVCGLVENPEQFREQGIKILVEPIVKPWGQTIAYIADPDGNYIEICSSLE